METQWELTVHNYYYSACLKSCNNSFFSTTTLTEDSAAENRLVIIQCDSGHTNGDLIAYARYCIYELRADVRDKDEHQITHVLFIIRLPHQVISSSYVGFQGSPWISSHIDDLRPTANNSVSASEAIGMTISQLFLGFTGTLDQEQLPEADQYILLHQYNMPTANRSLYSRLHGCIQAAASKVKDFTIKRSTKRVEILFLLIPKEPSQDLGNRKLRHKSTLHMW